MEMGTDTNKGTGIWHANFKKFGYGYGYDIT